MELAPQSHIQPPRSLITGLVVGWILIALKCSVLPSLFDRWQVPVNAGWVIIPTLIFGAVVTLLIATHDWRRD